MIYTLSVLSVLSAAAAHASADPFSATEMAGGASFGFLEGSAFADFNGDGHLDSFECNNQVFAPEGMEGPEFTSQHLFLGNGDGTWNDATMSSGLFGPQCSGVAAADLDNDGDMDLITTHHMMPAGGCFVYINDGTGMFTMLPNAVDYCPGFPGGVAIGDADNDGLLDVYFSALNMMAEGVPFVESGLLLGDGTGHFMRVANSGTEMAEYPCSASFMDMDDDGDADLIVLGCNKMLPGQGTVPAPLYFYRNYFSETGVVSFEQDIDCFGIGERMGYWMSTAFGDVNNDGLLDVYIGNLGCDPTTPEGDFFYCEPEKLHAMFVNNGDGTYRDVAPEMGIASDGFNWGGALIDLENDGTHDLVTIGNLIVHPMMGAGTVAGNDRIYSPGRVFVNNGIDQPMTLVQDFGVYTGSGLSMGDADNDGLVDMMVHKGGFVHPVSGDMVESGQTLYMHNENMDGNNYLKVRLEGTTANRNAAGSKVVVTYQARECDAMDKSTCPYVEHRQARAVVLGSSAFSSHDPTMTFGLGYEGTIVAIDIQWPNGEQQSVRNADQIAPNRAIDIRQRCD